MSNEFLARNAARLRWAVLATALLIASLYVLARTGMQLGDARFAYRSEVARAAQSPLVGDAIMLLLLIALWRLSETLRALASGDFFSANVVRRFRSFAFWLLLVAVAGLVGPIAAALAGADGSSHPVQFTLDLRQLSMVIVTLFLFLLARLLERARALDEDMREIV